MSVVARCLFAWLIIAAPWGFAQGATGSTGWLAANDLANPYSSPIRRINPNSMQGTQPLAPQAPQAPAQRQQVNPRPPTLQNGGIGNGQNLRPAPKAPQIEPIQPPRPTTP
jgi:hypothetical protein